MAAPAKRIEGCHRFSTLSVCHLLLHPIALKLVSSHVARAAARVHTLISGADAMLSGADGPMEGLIAEILVSVPAGS
ncbi:MAG: hypothetical protein WB052_06055, partial [Pseudolabrys sp.]